MTIRLALGALLRHPGCSPCSVAFLITEYRRIRDAVRRRERSHCLTGGGGEPRHGQLVTFAEPSSVNLPARFAPGRTVRADRHGVDHRTRPRGGPLHAGRRGRGQSGPLTGPSSASVVRRRPNNPASPHSRRWRGARLPAPPPPRSRHRFSSRRTPSMSLCGVDFGRLAHWGWDPLRPPGKPAEARRGCEKKVSPNAIFLGNDGNRPALLVMQNFG